MEPVRIFHKETSVQIAQSSRKPRFLLDCVKDQILYRFRRGASEKSIAQKFGGSRADVERVIREKYRELWANVHGPDTWHAAALLGVL